MKTFRGRLLLGPARLSGTVAEATDWRVSDICHNQQVELWVHGAEEATLIGGALKFRVS